MSGAPFIGIDLPSCPAQQLITKAPWLLEAVFLLLGWGDQAADARTGGVPASGTPCGFISHRMQKPYSEVCGHCEALAWFLSLTPWWSWPCFLPLHSLASWRMGTLTLRRALKARKPQKDENKHKNLFRFPSGASCSRDEEKVVCPKLTYQFAIWQVESKDRPRVLRKMKVASNP